jgi:release factor glutamine methyltransferase
MTPREAFSWARDALISADPDDAALDAKLFVLEAWDRRANSIHLLPNVLGNGEQAARLFQFVRRRLAHEPTAYILGRKEFWSLNFLVSPAVLIPRPDSETLVRQALDLLPDRDRPYTVLDLGTGSGCLLLAFLSERPNARGFGVDASADALETAEKNAAALGFSGRAHFVHGDWDAGLAERFDLVLCNPPYIGERERASLAPSVRDHEPPQALFAGLEGFDAYRRIIPHLPALVRPGGIAVFEVGQGQGEGVADLMRAQGLEVIGIRDDLGGIPRSVAARA